MWIAFKNYYLRDEEQLSAFKGIIFDCCELLSKIIIFVTRNNDDSLKHDEETVVNCFQKLLSSWRGTTVTLRGEIGWRLWIAFKNYYLRDEEQHPIAVAYNIASCELLSKIIIFVTRNNGYPFQDTPFGVVNCFQKLLSSWRGTTGLTPGLQRGSLWIAFKNYYLRDEEQRFGSVDALIIGCELLSKIIIFVTRNNELRQLNQELQVVNCFQKLLSSWRGTTTRGKRNLFW